MVLDSPIIYAGDLRDKLFELHAQQHTRKGLSTGWEEVDECMRLVPGYMHIITGIPGCGKSEFVDALAVNTAHLHNWRWLFFSPENYPIELHLMKLVEKYLGKSKKFMTKDELFKGWMWASDHFTWMYPADDKCTLSTLLEYADALHTENPLNALVLDPWNEITPDDYTLSETQYISNGLTKLRKFGRQRKMATFLVAHPTKLQKGPDGQYPVPDGYSISGSAHWRNKADMLFTCHRHNPTVDEISVYVQKVKQKDYGHIGKVDLDYDFKSGRFKQKSQAAFELPGEELPF